VQLFTIFFSRPIEFGIATGLSVIMLVIVARAALSAEGGSGLARAMARPTTKWLFGLLFLGWALAFGFGLQLVPHEGANSPYGGIGLIMMFIGVFIMFGFLWAVIGE
jgi:RsiW-degrading membrane proteinase PrsW (M82 family)